MNIARINEVDNESLQDDLKRIAKAVNHTELFEIAGDLSRTGTRTFVEFEMKRDSKKNYFVIKSANLPLA